jgi:hypothetical protein
MSTHNHGFCPATHGLVAAQGSIFDKKKQGTGALLPSSSFSKYAKSFTGSLTPSEELT